MPDFFLPVLSHFQNENPWSASAGRLRYRILPTILENEADCFLTAEVWEGPWSYEFSTVEESKAFPLTEDGLEALRGWIVQQSDAVNARPPRTMAEDDQLRIE